MHARNPPITHMSENYPVETWIVPILSFQLCLFHIAYKSPLRLPSCVLSLACFLSYTSLPTCLPKAAMSCPVSPWLMDISQMAGKTLYVDYLLLLLGFVLYNIYGMPMNSCNRSPTAYVAG